MAMIKYNPYNAGDYFWFINSASPLPVLCKYFIIVGLEMKIRLADLVLLSQALNDIPTIQMFKQLDKHTYIYDLF
jgi:hypothetical protein